MDRRVFAAALRASAKVAFAAALVGCGGTVAAQHGQGAEDAAEPTDDASSPTAEASPIETPDAPGPGRDAGRGWDAEGLACNAPPPSVLFHTDAGSGAVGKETFDCCLGELAPLRATEAGPAPEGADAAAADPATVACCGAVVFAADQDYAETNRGAVAMAELQELDDFGWAGRETCCRVLDWPGGATCTPWGPPTPPAMPGEEPSFDGQEVA